MDIRNKQSMAILKLVNPNLFFSRITINVFLCIAQFGGFAVYILFISKNFQSVFNSIYGWDLDYRVYLGAIFLPTVVIWKEIEYS